MTNNQLGDLWKMAEILNNIRSSSSLQIKTIGLEGGKRFGTCKWKFGTPPGSIIDSHWSDHNKFFCLSSTCTNVSSFFTTCHASIVFTMWFYCRHGIQYWSIYNVASIPPSRTIFGKNGIGPSILHVAKTSCIKIRWHIERTRPVSKV
jgi:hypothetical protein